MDALKLIKSRRSIRKFRVGYRLKQEEIDSILEAGRWAPSGMNNQPWRFRVITDRDLMMKLARCTDSSEAILTSSLIITVFIDLRSTVDRLRNIQSAGAAIENMWLEAVSIGLGVCWAGGILNYKDKADKVLKTPKGLELMTILAVGKPAEKGRKPERKPIKDFIV